MTLKLNYINVSLISLNAFLTDRNRILVELFQNGKVYYDYLFVRCAEKIESHRFYQSTAVLLYFQVAGSILLLFFLWVTPLML